MTEEIIPPDGGPRAVVVVIASFLCNGLIFGFINTYSILYVEILAIFEKVGVVNANPKACKFFNCINYFHLTEKFYIIFLFCQP